MRIVLTLALAALTLPAQQSPAAAPAQQVQQVQATDLDPSAPLRVGVGITQRRLSLSEAIEMALANNLELDIQRTQRDLAEQGVVAARGFFDPAFRWTPLFESQNTPVASVLQGAGGKLTNNLLTSNFSLRQKLQNWGTLGSIDFNNLRQTTNNPFVSFNPTLISTLALNVRQPLLRGLRTDRERAELRIRRKQADLSGVELEARTIDVVTRTESAYYDLLAAREAAAVASDLVGLGREQVAINNRLIRAGSLAPVELSAAEAELQRRIDNWYSALGGVTEAENNLKLLIAPERAASIWGDEIIPTEASLQTPAVDTLREAMDMALQKRSDLRALQVRSEVNDIEKQLNADLRRPQVDIVSQYSLNGLAGSISSTPNPFANINQPLYDRLNRLSVAQGLEPLAPTNFGGPPGFLVGGYGTTLSNLFGGNFQSFQAGLSIDLPIRNRTAEANYAQSRIREKQLRLERTRAEQVIEVQVRSALQGIETARQRIAAAEASAAAALEKLESERRLYQNGESTNFLVLTRQNEYADSRRRAVVARLDFNRSVVRLEQALGATLAARNITIQ